MFKVGDRIENISPGGENYRKLGTIAEVNETSYSSLYAIKYDDGNTGHGNDSHYKLIETKITNWKEKLCQK